MSGNSSTGRVGHLEPAGAGLRPSVPSAVASRLISSSVLSRRICVSWLIGRIAEPARLTLMPRSLVADADLGVEGDEREAVVLGDGLDAAQDLLGGPGGHRGGRPTGTPSATRLAGTSPSWIVLSPILRLVRASSMGGLRLSKRLSIAGGSQRYLRGPGLIDQSTHISHLKIQWW